MLACLVLLAACGGSSSDSTPSPSSTPSAGATPLAEEPGRPRTTESTILESPDGLVELEVPAGAVLEGTELAIEMIDPSDLAGLDGTTPIGFGYRLQPTDITFPEPLILSYRFPAETAGSTSRVPLVYTMIEADGVLRRTSEQRTESSPEGELVHLSEIEGFGTIVMLDGGVTFSLEPDAIAIASPGDSFEATVTATFRRESIEPWPNYGVEMRWHVAGAFSAQSSDVETLDGLGTDTPEQTLKLVNRFTCDQIGDGGYSAEIGIDVSTHFDDVPTRQFITVSGESSCGDVGR